MRTKALLIIIAIALIITLFTSCDSPRKPNFTKGWDFQFGRWDGRATSYADTLRQYYSKGDSAMVILYYNKIPVKVIKSRARLVIK